MTMQTPNKNQNQSDCTGIHCTNCALNYRCPSLVVLRLGGPYRLSVSVSSSEAVDVEVDKILLQRGCPRFKFGDKRLALMVDDLANDFADRTSYSTAEVPSSVRYPEGTSIFELSCA